MLASILAREEITRGDNPMLAPTDERMSRVDTAWLRMDNDVNLMMIVGVWLLQPAITLAALRERVGDWLTDAVVKPFTDLTVKAIGMYGSGVAKSMDMLANPYQPLFGSLDMAKSGYQVVSDVAAMALMADDSPTALKGMPSGAKKV